MQLRMKILRMMQKRQVPMKASVRGDFSKSFTSCAEYSVSVLLALSTMVEQPAAMKIRAGKS